MPKGIIIIHIKCRKHILQQYNNYRESTWIHYVPPFPEFPQRYICPEMEDLADTVAHKYGETFLLLSKCHNKFNSQGQFTSTDIGTLCKLKQYQFYTILE